LRGIPGVKPPQNPPQSITLCSRGAALPGANITIIPVAADIVIMMIVIGSLAESAQ
jgi:hypothetical protein